MLRRDFIKLLGLASSSSILLPKICFAQSTDYDGKFLVTIQVEGGWDVTSFCDPKVNQDGEKKINYWADNSPVQVSGNIPYAPFAKNSDFFDKYYNDILVINGVDAQTNSHSTGVTHNWSGRISEGFPSLTALFSAIKAPDLPMSYINNGGFSYTANLTRFTRLESVDQINNIAKPNNLGSNDDTHLQSDDWALIQQFHQNKLNSSSTEENLLPRQKLNRTGYLSALKNSGGIAKFSEAVIALPSIEETKEQSSLNLQAQLAALAFSTGVSVSADLFQLGFDTHADHDADHAISMAHLTEGIDKLWQYATEYGVADKLVVVIGSDFGRTPYYNDTNGKDHWPIGSYIVMEKGASYTNSVIGKTDASHNALKINPNSLIEDENNGVIIYPKHVMQALREYLGINNSALTAPFAFDSVENFNFFQR